MAAHVDPVNGDCEEVQACCPWTQIGCPETEVRINLICRLLRNVSLYNRAESGRREGVNTKANVLSSPCI